MAHVSEYYVLWECVYQHDVFTHMTDVSQLALSILNRVLQDLCFDKARIGVCIQNGPRMAG